MSRYLLVLRCRSCKYKYKRTVTVADGESVDDCPDPPCPKCAKRVRRVDASETATAPLPFDGLDFSKQKAPGIVGANTMVAAIDQTAEIVMKDYALSNLKDNVRQGDIMAPRLPPAQQKAADNFFVPQRGTGNTKQRARMQQIARGAIAGSYRNSALDVKSVLPDARVALRRVGVEAIKGKT